MTASHTQSGSITLGVVFGLGLMSLSLVSLALSSVTNTVGTHRTDLGGLRTFITAESAAREGVHQLLHNQSFNGNSAWLASSINSVNTSGITVDRSLWPQVLIRGGAENVIAGRAVQYTVSRSELEVAFDHAVYSRHDLDISGNVEVSGSMYAGGNLSVTTAAAEINGNTYANGTIVTHQNVQMSGQVQQGVPYIDPPYINPAPYRTTDPKCTQVVPNSGIVNNSLKWNQCDVVYLRVDPGKLVKGGWPAHWDGVLLIEGNANMNGGDFSCAGSCSNPLAIYVDGNLDLAGNVDVRGLVYVTGLTTVGTGNPEIIGSLMSVNGIGGVDINGNLSVTYDPALMAGWKNINGLNTSSHHAPTVTNFQEV